MNDYKETEVGYEQAPAMAVHLSSEMLTLDLFDSACAPFIFNNGERTNETCFGFRTPPANMAKSSKKSW